MAGHYTIVVINIISSYIYTVSILATGQISPRSCFYLVHLHLLLRVEGHVVVRVKLCRQLQEIVSLNIQKKL
jgi:hypothetical protein